MKIKRVNKIIALSLAMMMAFPGATFADTASAVSGNEIEVSEEEVVSGNEDTDESTEDGVLEETDEENEAATASDEALDENDSEDVSENSASENVVSENAVSDDSVSNDEIDSNGEELFTLEGKSCSQFANVTRNGNDYYVDPTVSSTVGYTDGSDRVHRYYMMTPEKAGYYYKIDYTDYATHYHSVTINNGSIESVDEDGYLPTPYCLEDYVYFDTGVNKAIVIECEYSADDSADSIIQINCVEPISLGTIDGDYTLPTTVISEINRNKGFALATFSVQSDMSFDYKYKLFTDEQIDEADLYSAIEIYSCSNGVADISGYNYEYHVESYSAGITYAMYVKARPSDVVIKNNSQLMLVKKGADFKTAGMIADEMDLDNTQVSIEDKGYCYVYSVEIPLKAQHPTVDLIDWYDTQLSISGSKIDMETGSPAVSFSIYLDRMTNEKLYFSGKVDKHGWDAVNDTVNLEWLDFEYEYKGIDNTMRIVLNDDSQSDTYTYAYRNISRPKAISILGPIEVVPDTEYTVAPDETKYIILKAPKADTDYGILTDGYLPGIRLHSTYVNEGLPAMVWNLDEQYDINGEDIKFKFVEMQDLATDFDDIAVHVSVENKSFYYEDTIKGKVKLTKLDGSPLDFSEIKGVESFFLLYSSKRNNDAFEFTISEPTWFDKGTTTIDDIRVYDMYGEDHMIDASKITSEVFNCLGRKPATPVVPPVNPPKKTDPAQMNDAEKTQYYDEKVAQGYTGKTDTTTLTEPVSGTVTTSAGSSVKLVGKKGTFKIISGGKKATVSKTGKITFKKKGKIKVQYTAADGSVVVKTVTVQQPSLKAKKTLKVGQSTVVSLKGCTMINGQWSAKGGTIEVSPDNTSVTFTATKKGKAKITCKINKKKYVAQITVK